MSSPEATSTRLDRARAPSVPGGPPIGVGTGLTTGAGVGAAAAAGVAIPVPATAPASSGNYDLVPSHTEIAFQRFWGWLLILPFCGILALLFRYLGGYRIENHRELRAKYRELARDQRPLMICLNHLTYIDSALMIWALGSNLWYQFNYSRFSWNLPAGDHFKKKAHHRLVAYLAKCLFIHRDGTKRHKQGVLNECMRLLRRGEVVTIFPEGKRSRTGRFELDRLTYGVGKVCSEVRDCRVLCAYIRGHGQAQFSAYPARGSRFRIETSVIEPRTALEGREACADLTSQIAREIKRLEDTYFAGRAGAGA